MTSTPHSEKDELATVDIVVLDDNAGQSDLSPMSWCSLDLGAAQMNERRR
jgi:hypothetical protein